MFVFTIASRRRRVLDPQDLVEAARMLLSGATPSEAAMRRAVSTAYYALFHALARFAADRFIAPQDMSAAYALVYRGLDHKRIKDVFEDTAKPTMRAVVQKALRRATISPELAKFAESFVSMQHLRHIADYHPEFTMSFSEVGDLVDDVENSLGKLSAINRDEMTAVVAYMLVGARG